MYNVLFMYCVLHSVLLRCVIDIRKTSHHTPLCCSNFGPHIEFFDDLKSAYLSFCGLITMLIFLYWNCNPFLSVYCY